MKTDKATRDEIMEIIKELTGQANILTIPRMFIKITGDLNSGLLLNQIIYWTGKGYNKETGAFYKTYREWEEEIGLGKNQVEYSKKRLEKLQLIDTMVLRAEGSPTVHYKLNYKKLVELIKSESVRNGLLKIQKSIAENSEMDCGKFRKHNRRIHQETTAEITTHTPLPPPGVCEKETIKKEKEGLDRKEEKKEITPYLSGFLRFWAAYPKKKSKGEAETAFLKIKPDDRLLEVILAGLERAKASRDWRRDGGRYVPYAGKWLNALGWEDEDEIDMPVFSQYGAGVMEWLAEQGQAGPD